MSTVLKSRVDFADVAPGGSATAPHGLELSGAAHAPDMILLAPSEGFTAVADTVNVTVTNHRAVVGQVTVFCEHWHSYNATTGEDWQPYVG